jgi:hypothetical protein
MFQVPELLMLIVLLHFLLFLLAVSALAAKARHAQVLPTTRWVQIAERSTERGGEERAH